MWLAGWSRTVPGQIGSTYIGGLECPLQDSNGMVLCCDIAKSLGSALSFVSDYPLKTSNRRRHPYYFSTQGCTLAFSFVCFSVLLDAVPFAPAALRAFRSKKFAIGSRRQ